MKNLTRLLDLTKKSFLCRWASVLLAVCLSDYVWTRYVAGIANAERLSAAIWAVAVIVLGAFVVISYVHDRRLIVPAAIGAFIGTYYGV